MNESERVDDEVISSVYYRAHDDMDENQNQGLALLSFAANKESDKKGDLEDETDLSRKEVIFNEGKASFNMINSIIGAGIIGIPYALHEAGFVVGVVLLIVVAIITDYSLRLLIKCGIISGKYSYQETIHHAFGNWGFWYLSVIQFLFPFSGMVGYLVIVGDTIPEVLGQISALEGSVLTSPEFMKFLMVMIVMLPLSLYKEIEKLGKVSAISILCVGFIVLVIIIRAGTMGPDIPVTSDGYSIARSGFFQAVGIMAFAFVCHHNSFLIYKSIQNYSIEKFSRVTHISVFVSWCACSVLGLAGYLTFTGNTEGDLLRNYCPDDVLLLVTRFLYAITIMLTFPIECFVAREVVSVLYVNIRKDGKETKLWFHILVTCGIVGLALGIALPINNLGTVLEFTGCLTATPLAFILPAAGYLKVADGRVLSQKKLPALFLFLFGLAVMLIGTVLAIIETVDDSRICDQWSYCNRTLTIVNSSSVYCVQYV